MFGRKRLRKSKKKKTGLVLIGHLLKLLRTYGSGATTKIHVQQQLTPVLNTCGTTQ